LGSSAIKNKKLNNICVTAQFKLVSVRIKHMQNKTKMPTPGLEINTFGLGTTLLSCLQVNTVRICTVRYISTSHTPRKSTER